MKSLRLTKQLRENILESFVAKYKEANTPPQEPKSERQLGQEFADKVHQKVYGKYLSLVPEYMFNLANAIRVQLPNDGVQWLYFGENEKGSCKRPCTNESKIEYVFTDSDPIFLEYSNALNTCKVEVQQYQEYNKVLAKFKSDVSQVLESVNTTKQLVEVWPESEPFLPKEVSNPSSINLPAVNFAEINKVIQ